MATLSAAPNALARRIPRVDTRLAIGVVMIAVSILVGLRISAHSGHPISVLAARRDLPAGHVLTDDDLRTISIDAGDGGLHGVVRSGARPLGRELTIGVSSGAVLPSAAIGQPPEPGRELTVPIAAEHALGGALRPGDRVDVLASFAKNTDTAKTLTVTNSARVLDVMHSDGLFGQGESGVSAVTLSVKAGDAVFLAFAMRNGELDLVRATGPVSDNRPGERFDASELP